MSKVEDARTATSLRIAMYCVAIPLGSILVLFLLWLILHLSGAENGVLLGALLWALVFLIGMVAVGIGAVALAVYAWKGFRGGGQGRRVLLRTIATAAFMVAYFYMGFAMALTMARAMSGPRQPSRDIHHAVNRKDPQVDELVRFLDEGPEAVHARDDYGCTPLHWAVSHEFRDMTELLIARGADVNARSDTGYTPLHSAVEGDVGLVSLLISKGAEVNVADEDGNTPLHYAARYAFVANVEALIDSGADLNVTNQGGDTPLDGVIKQWEVQVDAWEKGECRATPKDWEEKMQEWEQCIELLRQNGGKAINTSWPQERPHPAK